MFFNNVRFHIFCVILTEKIIWWYGSLLKYFFYNRMDEEKNPTIFAKTHLTIDLRYQKIQIPLTFFESRGTNYLHKIIELDQHRKFELAAQCYGIPKESVKVHGLLVFGIQLSLN